MFKNLWRQITTIHKQSKDKMAVFKYIGPGILVTVGFIDPGNWAVNLAAGASYGYTLLWTVTLSTIMLILLQHNVAHLGIVTGECLAEATRKFIRPWIAIAQLCTAMLAVIATALAELLGAAIALNMLFKIPIIIGAIITAVICTIMLMTNSYRKLEMWIAGFVSLVAASYLFELSMVKVDWAVATVGWVLPKTPAGSMFVIMGIIGAVIMPHNLFLHSEIIQSRQWNLEDSKLIVKQLRYEFVDTLFSMGVGWAINSAMIILAATTFFAKGIKVDELQQAQEMLVPLLGSNAAMVFALALLFAGFASTATAGMAGASIFAGIFRESYEMKDIHSRLGLLITYIPALVILLFISDPFYGLILSQVLLSIQLPFTIFLQLYLTSSKEVMGKYANKLTTKILLVSIGIIVTLLNFYLIWELQN